MQDMSEQAGTPSDSETPEQADAGRLTEAQAIELYDQVLLLNQALRGVISVGLCAPLHELNAELLNGYMQSIHYLVDENSALTREAFGLLLPARSSI